ncbi:MAG: hypothetical protein M1840_004997 [Geoglossum simile]|nr:MAG: hypothetical protein M1840_004997 [Geoglossum simile]
MAPLQSRSGAKLFDSTLFPALQTLSKSVEPLLKASIFVVLAFSPTSTKTLLDATIPYRPAATLFLLLIGAAHFGGALIQQNPNTRSSTGATGITASLQASLAEPLSALKTISKSLGTYFTVGFFTALAWYSPLPVGASLPFQPWVYCLLLAIASFVGFLAPISKFYGPLRFGYHKYSRDFIQTYKILLSWWVYAAFFPIVFTFLSVGLICMSAGAWFTVYREYRAQLQSIADQAAVAVSTAMRAEAHTQGCALAARQYETQMLDTLAVARRDALRAQSTEVTDFFDCAARSWAALGQVAAPAAEVTRRAREVVDAAMDVDDTEKPDKQTGELAKFLVARAKDAIAAAEGVESQLRVAQEAVRQSEEAKMQRDRVREAAAANAREAAVVAARLASGIAGSSKALLSAANSLEKAKRFAEKATGAAAEGEMESAQGFADNAKEAASEVVNAMNTLSSVNDSVHRELLGFLQKAYLDCLRALSRVAAWPQCFSIHSSDSYTNYNMAPTPIYSYTETKPPNPPHWIYPKIKTGIFEVRKPGAFRVISVDGLRTDPRNPGSPQIHLWQYDNIVFGSKTRYADLLSIQYVAASHVWSYGDEINKEAYVGGQLIRPLKIITKDNPGYKEISWIGLVQIANAAHELGVKYIWLDFLCMDQVGVKKDLEKKLQICLMADIYTQARSVVTMIGGIPQVQRLDGETSWMDRAWTLQETVLPIKKGRTVWVYVIWPGTRGSTDVQDVDGISYSVRGVAHEPTLRLIDITVLLDMADTTLLSPFPQVKVLDGKYGSSGVVPRCALRAAIHLNKYVSSAGVWRSMFLRTSSHPVDIVYSVMGIFGLRIDPYRDERQVDYLFYDLARKTAAIGEIGPAWLTISGVRGSTIPRDGVSRILPRYPDSKPDKKPTYPSDKWVGDFVDQSADYIKRFDIKFVTHSQPHIINARMLPVTHFQLINRNGTANVNLGSNQGTSYYNGPPNLMGLQAVYVGQVGKVKIGIDAKYPDAHYFLFMKWDRGNGGWDVLGDGVFVPRRASTFNFPLKPRWIFTVGKGAQTQTQKWLQTGNSLLDVSTQKLNRTYGVVPLSDFNISKPSKSAPKENPQIYSINFGVSNLSARSLDIKLKRPTPLYLVSSRTDDNPKTLTSPTRTKLTQLGKLDMMYTSGAWSKSICTELSEAGVQGIMIPITGKKPSSGSYYVKLHFGAKMIYLMTAPLKNPRPEYWQIAVIPYGSNEGILNKKYLLPDGPTAQELREKRKKKRREMQRKLREKQRKLREKQRKLREKRELRKEAQEQADAKEKNEFLRQRDAMNVPLIAAMHTGLNANCCC